MIGSELFAVIGIGITGALIAVLLRQYHLVFSMLVTLAVSILIFCSAMQWCLPIIERGKYLLDRIPALSEHARLLLKVIGISILTQLSGNLCKDAGESTVAMHVETAGKLLILAVSLPMFDQILELILVLLGL